MSRHLASLLLLAAASASGCGTSQAAAEKQPSAEEFAATPAAGGGECGNKGQPDCPLQRWMKATLQTYQRAGDNERLARAFNELAEHAPPGFASWKAHSERGAQLAANKDAEGIKKVCKDCHQEHRAQYRSERRAAPVW